MIPIPEKGGPLHELHEQLQGRFGKAGMDFILGMAREINRLSQLAEPVVVPVDNDYEIPSSSVNPPEANHAGIQAQK